MKTYRYRGHSRTDPGKYRPDGELDRWRERDPIVLLGAKLAAAGTLSEQDQAALRDRVQESVDATADRAKQGAFPTIEEIRSYVYAA
jgi:pyruvate dehydrogenase E1 component alpha subunit